jgi:hypothetical protein
LKVQQTGTVDHTPVYVREVVKRALELSATAIVLVHNHPSGDPTPSRADIEMTRQIVAAAKPLGVMVHDHIIVGKQGHANQGPRPDLALPNLRRVFGLVDRSGRNPASVCQNDPSITLVSADHRRIRSFQLLFGYSIEGSNHVPNCNRHRHADHVHDCRQRRSARDCHLVRQ